MYPYLPSLLFSVMVLIGLCSRSRNSPLLSSEEATHSNLELLPALSGRRPAPYLLRIDVSTVPFAGASAELSGEGRALLRELARTVLQNPNFSVRVEEPRPGSGLGARRAAVVVDFLAAEGIPAGRLSRELRWEGALS